MTVEEVATLASRLGWSYEPLMAMTGAERRLWLAASERVLAAEAARRPVVQPSVTHPAAPAAPRVPTEAERRERLARTLEEMVARRMQ